MKILENLEDACFGEATLLEYCFDEDDDQQGDPNTATFLCNETVDEEEEVWGRVWGRGFATTPAPEISLPI